MSAARADSDAGSVNPPAESNLVTGDPNIAQATITSAAAAMIRLGAAIAASAIRCRLPPAVGSALSAEPSTLSRRRVDIVDHCRSGQAARQAVGDEVQRTTLNELAHEEIRCAMPGRGRFPFVVHLRSFRYVAPNARSPDTKSRSVGIVAPT